MLAWGEVWSSCRMHPPILGGFALNDGTHSWFNEHELLNPTAL